MAWVDKNKFSEAFRNEHKSPKRKFGAGAFVDRSTTDRETEMRNLPDGSKVWILATKEIGTKVRNKFRNVIVLTEDGRTLKLQYHQITDYVKMVTEKLIGEESTEKIFVPPFMNEMFDQQQLDLYDKTFQVSSGMSVGKSTIAQKIIINNIA